MTLRTYKLVAAFLVLLTWLATPTGAQAFDIGIILERVAMEQLEIAPEETPLAIGGNDRTKPYVVVALGESTFFIDQYGPDKKRTSRSIALPAQQCADMPSVRLNDRWEMSLIEMTSGIVIYSNPCPSGDTIFFQDKDGNISSFVRPTINTVGAGLAVRVFALKSAATLETNLTALMTQLTVPSTGEHYAPFTIAQTAAPAHDAPAFARLVNRPRAQVTNETAHLAAVRSGVAGLDWRVGLNNETLNNAAFYLARSDGCRDLETSVAMMDRVIAGDPNRHIANLNLADTYAKAHRLNCNNLPSSLGASQEAFRLYCSGIGRARVPGAIAARYRDAFVASRTTEGKSCHPQFAMQRAIVAGDGVALARALADRENDVDITFPNGDRALGLALERKNGGLARQLLAADANPDRSRQNQNDDRSYEYTPMVRAIWNYDVESVAALVAKGKSALDFTMDISLYRPFLIAVGLRAQTSSQETQKLAIITLLETLEPNPLSYGTEGENAFYTAAGAYSSQAVFDRVAKSGAFINHPNQYGRTPLFGVGPFAGSNAAATQAILLRMGANPNQQNSSGETPLRYAFAFSGSDSATLAAMVQVLLDGGTDPNLADQNGKTALYFAALRAMPETVDLLIARGAKLPPTKRYETDPIVWVTTRINEIETYPARYSDCSCLGDYKRILAALKTVAPTTP